MTIEIVDLKLGKNLPSFIGNNQNMVDYTVSSDLSNFRGVLSLLVKLLKVNEFESIEMIILMFVFIAAPAP